jgi:hypothetical protein
MNHRRALRASTNTGLTIFLITIVGVVLWTTDEVLGWNILPDWIDKYAQVLVIVVSILAGFSVVISLMCSFALMAEAAAEKASISSPAPSPGARRLIALGILLAFATMFGLHKIDQYRANQRRKAEEQRNLARYNETQQQLQTRMPDLVALFTPELRQHLVANGSETGDEALARLLNAIHLSTPYEPEVSIVIRAQAPYRYCAMTARPEPRHNAPEPTWRFLRRQFFTDLPSQWEREAIATLFRDRSLAIPKDRQGLVIDTRRASVWDTVKHEGEVVALLVLKATS